MHHDGFLLRREERHPHREETGEYQHQGDGSRVGTKPQHQQKLEGARTRPSPSDTVRSDFQPLGLTESQTLPQLAPQGAAPGGGRPRRSCTPVPTAAPGHTQARAAQPLGALTEHDLRSGRLPGQNGPTAVPCESRTRVPVKCLVASWGSLLHVCRLPRCLLRQGRPSHTHFPCLSSSPPGGVLMAAHPAQRCRPHQREPESKGSVLGSMGAHRPWRS